MLEHFDIIAQGKDNEQWISLVIFLIIIALNVVGGLVKSFKDRIAEKRQNEQGQDRPQSKRYRSVDQWDKKTSGQGQARQVQQVSADESSPQQNRQEKREGSLSPKLEDILAERLAAKRAAMSVPQQRAAEPPTRRQIPEKNERQRQLENRQKLAQKKMLEKQKQITAQREGATRIKKSPKLQVAKVETKSEPSEYDLVGVSSDQLKNFIVAGEILAKPLALRDIDERII